MDKILPLHKSKVIDHGPATIENFWHFRPAVPPPPLSHAVAFMERIQRLIGVKGPKVLIVLSRQISHAPLLQLLLRTAQSGTRVYLLSTERVADKALAGNCLMRFGLPLHGAFVLTDPQQKARGLYFDDVFSEGALLHASDNLIEMDATQCALAFQFFCYHFWTSAKEEILNQSAQASQVPAEAPFSILQPADQVQALRTMLADGSANAACLAAGVWPLTQLTSADILTQAQIADPIALGQHNELCVTADELPMQWISGRQGDFLLPKSATADSTNAFVLPLHSAQSTFFQSRFQQYMQTAERRFVRMAKRGEMIEARILRIGVDTAPRLVLMQSEHQHDIRPTCFLPLAELQSLEPDFTDASLACSQHHQWTIHPFTLPAAAKPDPLYEAWQKKHNAVQTTCQALADRLQQLMQSKTQLTTQVFQLLKQVFLGKEQRWATLKDDLEVLLSRPLESLSPKEYLQRIREINSIAQQVDESDRQVQAHKAHAEKTAVWEAKDKELETRLAELQDQINKTQKEHEHAKDAEDIELQLREVRLNEFLTAHSISGKDLKTLKSKWEQEAGAKQRKKHPEQAAKAEEMLKQLERCDPSVLILRNKSDQDKREKSLRQNENELARKTEERQKHQQAKPRLNLDPESITGEKESSLLDGLQAPQSAPQTTKIAIAEDLPEALPATGQLYLHDKQRYLAIHTWQEASDGSAEAERLKAKLCVHP